ncbi:hypothetical protein HDU92_006074 [Lobulomyces angularis]|nr:hypothetical protein HDU92_006074 [Lobulomyces angularis]
MQVTKLITLQEFPAEILILILTNLDPISLRNSTLISKKFNFLINDEKTWKDATLKYYNNNLYTRVYEDSWKFEHLFRFNLLKQFKRPKKIFTTSLNLNFLKIVYADLEKKTIYLVNFERGILFRYFFDTGNLSKKLINLNLAQTERQISAISMISREKVLIGYPNGSVAIVFLNKLHSISYFDGNHISVVNQVTFIDDNLVLSTCVGNIKIWSVSQFNLILDLDLNNLSYATVNVENEQNLVVTFNDLSVKIYPSITHLCENYRNGRNFPQPFSFFPISEEELTINPTTTVLQDLKLIKVLPITNFKGIILICSDIKYCFLVDESKNLKLNLFSNFLISVKNLKNFENFEKTKITCCALVMGVGEVLIIFGDKIGEIKIFSIPLEFENSVEVKFLLKIATNIKFESVTWLVADKFKIISKAGNYIKLWDLNSGELICALKDKNTFSRHLEEEENREENAVFYKDDLLISTSIKYLKSWEFSKKSNLTLLNKEILLRNKNKSGSNRRGHPNSVSPAKNTKFKSKNFNKNLILNDIQKLKDDDEFNFYLNKKYNKIQNPSGLDLTDEELLNYAMLLSTESLTEPPESSLIGNSSSSLPVNFENSTGNFEDDLHMILKLSEIEY